LPSAVVSLKVAHRTRPAEPGPAPAVAEIVYHVRRRRCVRVSRPHVRLQPRRRRRNALLFLTLHHSRSRSAHLERRVPQPPGLGPPSCIHPETPGYLLTPPSSPAGRFVSAAQRHHLFASLSQGSCVARPISALFTRQGGPIEAWKSLSGAFCGNYGWAKEAWLCLVRSLRGRIPARMRVGRRVGQWGPWRSWDGG
ncbi:hypothetical protein BS50DRAFT_580, partial [Corynespora cassiicola Philippines]